MTLRHVRLLLFYKNHVINHSHNFNLYIFLKKAPKEEVGWAWKRWASGSLIKFY